MRRASLRGLLLIALISLFGASLLVIVLTGPVVLRVPPVRLILHPSAERLRADVERLCGEFAPRDYLHPENLDRAAEWIAAELRGAGLTVAIEDYRTPEGTFRNVVARRTGADASAGAIIVGAHYDAYVGSPGADDNASGVAVLLELARTLPPTPSRRTQIFVAFGTQEAPFFGTEKMGSHVFASDLVRRGVPVELMIALDLVGYFSTEPGSQHAPRPLRWVYPDRADFIAVVGDLRAGPWLDRVKRGMMSTSKLGVHSLRAPAALAPVGLSDHASFRALGLPGVLVTDTAFMRYPYYHTGKDTPDRLDYPRMAQLVLGLQGVLWEPATAP